MRFTVIIGSFFAALAIAAPTPIDTDDAATAPVDAQDAEAVDKRACTAYTCSNIKADKFHEKNLPRPGKIFPFKE